jgi:hypothetical protein
VCTLDHRSTLKHGVRKQCQYLVDTGHERWAADALNSLTIQLQDDGDLDGLWALHRTAGRDADRNALASISFQPRNAAD